jgi:hypothetical protein
VFDAVMHLGRSIVPPKHWYPPISPHAVTIQNSNKFFLELLVKNSFHLLNSLHVDIL